MKDSIKKNTLSLAVILALQAMSVHAEDSVKIAETAINPEKKQDSSAAKELSEVNVKSTSIQSSDGYQATKTRVGKVLQDPHDIPQAVTTITNSLIIVECSRPNI
jgi:catecholate siderophore receptor